MARTGLYKSEVKKARDALLAQGKHPSVDAMRIALGNTGSKTTIHKYLKELEEEEGGADGRKASLSEAIQDLVSRLAAQLQAEASAQLEALQARQAEQERLHAAAAADLKKADEALRTQLKYIESTLQEEQTSHARTREFLQRETVARHTAEQQVVDLKERLTENEAHRQSLEDKHQHAREALEHYRASVKEQRDQDQRRHEQQIQQLQTELRQAQQTIVVKQEDITRLNQDGVRLIADLSHAKKALYDEKSQRQQLEHKLQVTLATEQRCTALESQLADKIAQAHALQKQQGAAAEHAEKLSGQVHDLQLALSVANTRLETQQGMVMELRAFLDERQQSADQASTRRHR